ncbi:MAG: WD40 repeat domain-containing protein [Planctomycetes bacterium]|nr:WD40 repeat domain-containing protein [Planctomycetota bacterium]
MDLLVRAWPILPTSPIEPGTAAINSFSGPKGAVTAVDVIGTAADSVLAAASADGSVYYWPLPKAISETPLAPTATFAHGSPVKSVSVSADGTRIAAGADDQFVRVWDVVTGRELQRFAGHEAAVASVDFAGPTTVVSAGADKSVRLWSVNATRVVVADEASVTDLAARTVGPTSIVATVGSDKVVRVWSADGKPAGQLAGPTASVAAVVVRPDARQVVATSATDVFVWDLPAALPATPVPATAQFKTATVAHRVRYRADGTQFAVGTEGGRVQLHDATDARLLEVITQAAPVTRLAFAPDQRTILVPGAANSAAAHRMSFVRLLAGHDGAVTSAAFAPAGTSLFTAGVDKTVRQWKLDDGTQLATFAGFTDAALSLSLSGDGKKLFAGGVDKTVLAWDVPAAAIAAPVAAVAKFTHAGIVQSVSANADGSRVATTCDDGLVRIWDVASSLPLEQFAGHEGAVTDVSFTKQGTQLVSAGSDKSVRVWTPAATKVLAAHEGGCNDVAFVGTGTQFVSAGADKTATLWSLVGAEVRKFAGATDVLTSLSVSPDNTLLAAGSIDKFIYQWTIADGAAKAKIETPAVVQDVRYGPQGTRLSAVGATGLLQVFDPVEGKLLHELKSEAALSQVAFSPSGRELVTGGADKNISVWAWASPVAVKSFAGHTGAVYDVAFAPDGKTIVSAGNDATLRQWDLAAGTQLRQIPGHAGAVYQVTFNGDGTQLVSGGLDGTVRLWNAATGAAVKTLALEDAEARSPVFALGLSPNGQLIATGGKDQNVRVWNVATGAVTQTLTGHPSAIYRVGFNATVTKLLAFVPSGSVRVWNLA